MGSRLRRVLAVLLLAGGGAAASSGSAVADIAGCSMFPADNVWNTRVDGLSVHPRSGLYINAIGPTATVHPDFGSGTWDGGPIGIPYAVVPGTQARVPVSFYYDDQSDPAGQSPKLYPVPPNAPLEGGSSSTGDRHVLLVDFDNCKLYEIYDASAKAR